METIEKTNRDCKVRDTYVCTYLGSNGCEKCTINARGVRAYQKEQIRDVWEVTLSNLPDDVDQLHESEYCQFCKGGKQNKAAGYGYADFAHSEPETEKGYFMGFGPKVRQPIGSLLQIPVSICPECKKHIAVRDRFKWLGALVGMLVTFAGLAVASLFLPLSGSETMWPLLVLILLTVGGYYVGWAFSAAYVKKHSHATAYNVFETDIGREMAAMGWFGFKEEEGTTKLRFSKSKPWQNYRIMPEGYVRPEKEQK